MALTVDCLMNEFHMQGSDSQVEETTLPKVSDMGSQLTGSLFRRPTITHQQRDPDETSLNGNLQVHERRMSDICL